MNAMNKIFTVQALKYKILEIENMYKSLGISNESEIDKVLKEAEDEIKNCEHTWKEYGHDSHKDFKQCTKCGTIEEDI